MRSWSSWSIVAIAALGPLACGGSPDVKIGAILSLSGPGASYGTSIRNGVDLAIDEINGAGGVAVDGGSTKPITLLFRDAQSDPRVGVEGARELLGEGIVAAIGSDVSDVTLALAPVFQEAHVVLLSPASSTPKLSAAGQYIFRNYPSDELEAVNTANYIYNQAGLREAAVIANQNEFGIGVKNAFIERFRGIGGRILAQTSYPPDATSFSAQADEIAAARPPGVYIAGYTPDSAGVAVALRAAGYAGPLFGTGAILTEELLAAGPDAVAAVEGMVYPHASFDADSDDPQVRAFVQAYEGKYGTHPDTYAAHGYDAMKILALAVRESGTNADEIRFYLSSMNSYLGVTGDTDFTETGDVRKFHTMLKVVGGRVYHVDEVPQGGAGPAGR